MSISFGSKSLFWLLVFVLHVILFFSSELSRAANFLQIDSSSAFIVGALASFLGILLYRVSRPAVPSPYRFSIHYKVEPEERSVVLLHVKNIWVSVNRNFDDDIVEIFPKGQFALMFMSLILAGILTFSQREIALIEKFPQQLTWGQTKFCPDPNQGKIQAEERPECQLLLRAHKLGYAEDLGDCGEFVEGPPVWCDLRQKDEPYFHFAWRRLKEAYDSSYSTVKDIHFDKKKYEEQIAKEIDRLKPLARNKMAEVAAEPRSLHFILSSLPEPEGWTWHKIKRRLLPSQCLVTESDYPNKLPEPSEAKDLSSNLVMAFGHLLFDYGYSRVISSCKEYHFLWGLGETTCRDIRKSPQATLTQLGLLDPIKKIIQRYEDKKVSYPNDKSLEPRDVISINCLEYGKERIQQKVYQVKLGRHKLWLKVLQHPKLEYKSGDSIQSFQLASKLASLRFNYGRLLSRSSLSDGEEVLVTEEMVTQDDFRFTRVVFLEEIDVFLNPYWLLEREDILEIYPYYLHLTHFVNSFRNNYAQGRGRL